MHADEWFLSRQDDLTSYSRKSVAKVLKQVELRLKYLKTRLPLLFKMRGLSQSYTLGPEFLMIWCYKPLVRPTRMPRTKILEYIIQWLALPGSVIVLVRLYSSEVITSRAVSAGSAARVWWTGDPWHWKTVTALCQGKESNYSCPSVEETYPKWGSWLECYSGPIRGNLVELRRFKGHPENFYLSYFLWSYPS